MASSSNINGSTSWQAAYLSYLDDRERQSHRGPSPRSLPRPPSSSQPQKLVGPSPLGDATPTNPPLPVPENVASSLSQAPLPTRRMAREGKARTRRSREMSIRALPGSGPGCYMCPKCNNTWATSQTFAAHMRCHHKKESLQDTVLVPEGYTYAPLPGTSSGPMAYAPVPVSIVNESD